MHFLVGTLIVLAIIYFMIVSPGFRAVAIILLVVLGIGVALIMVNAEKQSEKQQEQRVEAERRAVNSISPNELSLSNVSLVKERYGGWTLQGTLTNNSKFNLDSVRF
jgi:sensor domain CHASE-containing protein